MGGEVAELAELTALAVSHGVQWMDGTMWYHSNRTRQVAGRLATQSLGSVRRVTAAFTFKAPDDEWLNGGNGRTDKTREPMGCLGDQGWYPLSAILFAFNWEMPERIMATHTTLNTADTIVACSGVLWFSGGRSAVFDCGCTTAHRSQVEIVGETGTVYIDDLVGGQGRTGDFTAYEQPFVGSGSYVEGDVMGRDETIAVEPCDHVDALVQAFTERVRAIKEGMEPDPEWPNRSLAVHTVMSAAFESANNQGSIVTL